MNIQLALPADYTCLWKSGASQWVLREGLAGQKSVPVNASPFVLGRALNCQLVFPSAGPRAKGVSRWHCHIVEQGGNPLLRDGSFQVIPETGSRKPSAAGTLLNGSRISKPEPMTEGDEIGLGPWRLKVEKLKEPSVNADELFEKPRARKSGTLDAGDPRFLRAFADMEGLFRQMIAAQGADERMLAILNCAQQKIRSAGVAAILAVGSGGKISVRMAVQRFLGQVFDFQFSSGLLRKLEPGSYYLLEAVIADRTRSQAAKGISSGLVLPLAGLDSAAGYLYMDNRDNGMSFGMEDLFMAGALAGVAALQLAAEKQDALAVIEENLKEHFDSDAAWKIAEECRADPAALALSKRQAVVLCADIQGFGDLANKGSPAELGRALNEFYRLSAECIHRHGGIVDRFVGDSALGVFGAHPFKESTLERANPAAQAARAGRDLISEWRMRTAPKEWYAMALRAGLAYGEVTAGNFGFKGRIEYGVIGGAVGEAMRIEKLARPNGIALSDAAKEALGPEFRCESGGEAEIKGHGLVKVWHLAPW
ncbi:MAG: FHA domain-containing protein [Elusimicrobia bacterium]|nr:FHA domain-containing protein [Elusimicrobiota bacterium]